MSIAERYAEVRNEIAAACARAGRDPEAVQLIAVSKFQPVEAIEALYRAGQRHFGESYVQELAEKRTRLAHLHDLRWHLLGHLQTNKAKQALPLADYFHALDSEKLLREIEKRMSASGRPEPWPVFVQVNIDREASKAGVDPDQAEALVGLAQACPSVRLAGLMCIPEPRDDIEQMRGSFRALRELAHRIEAKGPDRGLQLSMGMSDDFGLAIEEGANWVRVGTKLFGERPQKR